MFDESRIVSRILQGDMQAFDSLVQQYERLVYSVVYRLVPVKADIEDVSQEVFIKVFRNLSRFAFQSKLSTWIAQIAYMTAVNHFSTYKRRRTMEYTGEVDEAFFHQESAERKLSEKDAAAQLERVIARLPEKYRAVLTLYHLKEFSYSEIVEIMGLPEGTVKTHLFRARQLLKETMEIYLKNEIR